MAKATTTFVCQSCGASYGRWQGKCENCGAWNTIAEESLGATGVGGAPAKVGAKGGKPRGRAFVLAGLDGANDDAPRTETQVGELDRVFGGAAKPLLVHFAQNSKLSPEEIKELKKLLDQQL